MKDIPGYEGEYSVTECGKVWSHKSNKWLKTSDDGHGYVHLALCQDGSSRHYKIYRLVAMTYLENPHKHPCINHKDGNKRNDHYSNLEWCTYSHNNYHAYSIGLRVRPEFSPGRRKKAVLISPDNQLHYVDWIEKFCEDAGISISNLWKVFNGERKHHKGWRGWLVIEPKDQVI